MGAEAGTQAEGGGEEEEETHLRHPNRQKHSENIHCIEAPRT